MAHVAGKTGSVIVADQLLENCEDAWSVAGIGTATSADPDTDHKVGDYSVKLVCGVGVNVGDTLATEVIGSCDITGHGFVMCWAKSSVNTAAGDMQVGVSETADMGGAPVFADLPALTANTWELCLCTLVTTGLNAVISVGAKLAANDPGAFDLYLDEIRAAKTVSGIKKWDIEYTAEVKETTDFGDAGVASFIPTITRWSGSFEGFKDSVQLPLTIGQAVYLALRETSTADQVWLGLAIITSIKAMSAQDDVVSYSYTFQGTGDLTPAAA